MAIVFAILLFSFLIFIHEFGHFIAAKLSGVQVNEFAIFMGPAIFKWGKGETQYSIRCIPIGGFCAMEGEDEDTDNPRSFQKSPWWKRLIILVAGSAMNFVTGFLIFLLVFSPAQMLNTPVIAQADPNCNIVSQDALQVGDRILEIGGEKVYVASNVSLLLNLEAADAYKGVAVEELASVTPATTDFLVERNGRKILLEDVSLKPLQVGVTENGAVSLMFGITLSREEADFGDILSYTWNNCVDTVRTVRLSLQMLFTGQASVQDLTGVVGLVGMMSETAAASETAWDAVLNMLYIGGFIAINLAVMNMLPIPALDGGRVLGLVLTTAIEKITGKKLSSKVEGYIHGVGMILLLALMAFVMFKDIFALF